MSDIRLLDALLTTHIPLLRRSQPFWAPAPVNVDVRYPSLNWERADIPDTVERITLDVNGAYMAPLSGTEFAHRKLVRTGADMPTHRPAPGYYLTEAPAWSDPRICSPLGGVQGDLVRGSSVRRVWLTAPTIKLLDELTAAGFWPGVPVYDSYTSEDGAACRMSAWAALVRDLRADAIDDGDKERLEAVKDSYVMALQMFRRPDEKEDWRSKVNRPDWYYTVRAQHAANQWRKVWRLVLAGIPPLKLEHTDAVILDVNDYAALLDMPDAPVRIDHTGRQLGAFKVATDA